ncbi:hypothetical protein VP1G_02144 [Cytospora mali]|uniref:Uncharacterized protein n=1 Tax=Cytospora mali TaxID=578113 RepID=A0A194USZ4_CYTMA|nr:hypothetical protein VP1G_02144 [Valsa mali var. pyri (nom. inval.)]
MHSNTISKSLLTLAALLAIAGSAPLPSATESAINTLIHPEFVNRVPIVSTFPIDVDVADLDKTAQNTKRRTGSSESSSLEHTESSESSSGGSGTPGLVNKIEPLAAGFVGKHIADKLEDVFGSTSETTTAAAATETAASSQKQRRKTTSNSGEGQAASSAAGSALKLGKTFLGDTLMSGGSTLAGDYLANKVEEYTGSSTEAASSRRRSVNAGEEKAASSLAGDAWKIGKQFLGDTAMSGGSTLAGDYLANKVEEYTGSSTQAASSRKRSPEAGDEEEASSVASDVWKFGKEFLKDTALNGGSTVVGDYLANKVEGSTGSATQTASASKRSSEASEEEALVPVPSGAWGIRKGYPNHIQDFPSFGEIEPSELPTTTTASAQKRSTGLSDFDESRWGDLEHKLRIGTIGVPERLYGGEVSDPTPTSIRAAKRKTSFGSTAKKFGTDAAEQGLSSLIGGWAAHKIEDEFGSDNTAPTPTAAASRKRSVAGTLAMKSGEKAAGKVVHDHTKNKTDSIESEFKDDAEKMKNKLTEIFSKVLGHHERDGSDPKMLRRSVDELQAIDDWILSHYVDSPDSPDSQVHRRTSVPIDEPVGSPSSSLEQRDPQGLFSLAKGMLKLADHSEPNTDGASENGHEIAEISTEIRKRSPEIGSDVFEGV